MPLTGDDPWCLAADRARALAARELPPWLTAGDSGTSAPDPSGPVDTGGSGHSPGPGSASSSHSVASTGLSGRPGAGSARDTSGEALHRGLLADLASTGLLGYVVPSAFGGVLPGVSVRALCAIREELAYGSGLLDLALVMQGLGSFPITLAGNDAQKRRYLPGVADGRSVAAFAVTEPDAGSDVGAITTAARRDGSGYVLEGAKTFISNGPFADLITVIARTAPPGGSPRTSLSAFVVEAGAAGLTREPMELIAPHPIGTLRFSGCRIAEDQRLGAEGEGFAVAMGTLDTFRTTVGAAAVGFARRALDESVHHAKGRVQFGRPISDFEGIQFKFADMATRLDAARLLVGRAAASADRAATTGASGSRTAGASAGPSSASRGGGFGAHVSSSTPTGFSISPFREDAGRDASMAKLFATEAAHEIVDEAVQIFGGRGLVSGNIVEALYREVRALRIYEGTSEIQRSLIARSLLRP